jgi:hypothetical protein
VDGRGIPGWVLGVLRWGGALIALVLLVTFAVPRAWEQLRTAVTLDTGESRSALPAVDDIETEPERTEEGTLVAVSDLATRNGTIQSRLAETILVGTEGADQILIGFEPVPSDAACIREAILEVFLVESEGVEIQARPAMLTDIRALEDGQALPPDAVIEGVAPALAFAAAGTSGWLRWDVRDAYILAHRSAPDDGLVVLSVAPTAGEEVTPGAVFGTTDNPEDWSARLSWQIVGGCDELGTGSVAGDDDLPPGDAEILDDPADA